MKKLFILIAILTFVINLTAQDSTNEYKYWLTLGAGVGVDEQTVSVNFNYSFSLGDNFYKIGYLHRGGILGGPGEDGLLNTAVDISIGKRIQSDWFQVSFFTGPSFIFGEKSIGHGDSEKFKTVGLETYMQLLFRPENALGIGFGVYGNLNFVKSYVGINLNLTIGNGK